MKTAPEERRWRAVLERDTRPRERWFYAVTTTRIYCRPGCPARTPRRDHVVFFSSAAEAERAGYRACRRCVPDGTDPRTARGALIAAARRLIEQADGPPTLAELSAAVGLSRFHLLRVFREALGMTPVQYYRWLRSRRLRAALSNGLAATDAIHDAGFGSSSRVYERSGDLLGMTPAAYARGAPRQTIRFALAETALGLLLVAATERGLCTIEFGRSRSELTALLRRRFPKARFAAPDATLDQWLGRLTEHLVRPVADLDLPLDLRGTVFQKTVWEALRRIPLGSTVTYAGLARALGMPKAVRAVAAACARNPAAIAVPCHRVIGTDGTLRGYRWGLQRKQALLKLEAAAARSLSDDPA